MLILFLDFLCSNLFVLSELLVLFSHLLIFFLNKLQLSVKMVVLLDLLTEFLLDIISLQVKESCVQ